MRWLFINLALKPRLIFTRKIQITPSNSILSHKKCIQGAKGLRIWSFMDGYVDTWAPWCSGEHIGLWIQEPEFKPRWCLRFWPVHFTHFIKEKNFLRLSQTNFISFISAQLCIVVHVFGVKINISFLTLSFSFSFIQSKLWMRLHWNESMWSLPLCIKWCKNDNWTT